MLSTFRGENMIETTELPISGSILKDIRDWVDEEAAKAKRSRVKQIEYVLEEARRIQENNHKATQDRG